MEIVKYCMQVKINSIWIKSLILEKVRIKTLLHIEIRLLNFFNSINIVK